MTFSQKKLAPFSFVLLTFAFVCFPLSTKAAIPIVTKPFGGRIFKIFPCIIPPGVAFKMINLAGFTQNFVGPLPLETFIWSPFLSRTFGFLPPLHVGQSVLGLTSIPKVCVTPSLDDVKGKLVVMIGASL